MKLLALFLAGALLCNAIPHLAAGLRGESFPTPFARPRGVGHSSPVMNFLWGSANLLTGGALLHGAPLTGWTDLSAFAAGWLALGAYIARHFAVVRKP